jgi:hypothetical protein
MGALLAGTIVRVVAVDFAFQRKEGKGRARLPHNRAPDFGSPGLNVNVAASLLGQFGNDGAI